MSTDKVVQTLFFDSYCILTCTLPMLKYPHLYFSYADRHMRSAVTTVKTVKTNYLKVIVHTAAILTKAHARCNYHICIMLRRLYYGEHTPLAFSSGIYLQTTSDLGLGLYHSPYTPPHHDIYNMSDKSES